MWPTDSIGQKLDKQEITFLKLLGVSLIYIFLVFASELSDAVGLSALSLVFIRENSVILESYYFYIPTIVAVRAFCVLPSYFDRFSKPKLYFSNDPL